MAEGAHKGPVEGDMAPGFSAEVSGAAAPRVSLSDYRGKPVVLYFYPKDDTPGCTTEACDFRDSERVLMERGIVVLGVSKDSVASHEKFRKKYGLPFPLISDSDGAICAAYGVIKEKNMYGIKRLGIERSTFVIGPDGRIRKVYRGVKVPGHVQSVLEAVEKGSKTGP